MRPRSFHFRRRTWLAVGGRDGLHVFLAGWHWHIFLWTRGHRRNPVYSTLRRYESGGRGSSTDGEQ